MVTFRGIVKQVSRNVEADEKEDAMDNAEAKVKHSPNLLSRKRLKTTLKVFWCLARLTNAMRR